MCYTFLFQGKPVAPQQNTNPNPGSGSWSTLLAPHVSVLKSSLQPHIDNAHGLVKSYVPPALAPKLDKHMNSFRGTATQQSPSLSERTVS